MPFWAFLGFWPILGILVPGPKMAIFGYFWKMGILTVFAIVGENAIFGKNGDFGENWENGENQENQDLTKMSRSAKKADF